MTKEKRLILFDIDGTLVNTGGAGIESLRARVRERFGAQDDFHDIEISGNTDMNIVRAILHKYGVAPTCANVELLNADYIAGLPEQLKRCRGRVLPGINELLAKLKSRSHIVMGLLTGNLREGARLKLEHYGLWHYFEFGAFADDHHDRNELGKFARERAREHHGHDFDAAAVDVVGDTGRDIACGKAFGGRTIAVATGSWTRQQLQECAPDFLFADFSEVDKVIATLGW